MDKTWSYLVRSKTSAMLENRLVCRNTWDSCNWIDSTHLYIERQESESHETMVVIDETIFAYWRGNSNEFINANKM